MLGFIGFAIAPLTAVILWRLVAAWPSWWLSSFAGVVSIAAVILTTILIAHQPNRAPRRLALLAGLAAAVALFGWIPDAWPCSVGCSDGARFGEWWGLPIVAWAGLIYATLAVIAGAQAHNQKLTLGASVLGWGCVGISVYYLSLSLYLGLLCSHCLAVHSIVLCFPAAMMPADRWKPAARLATLAMAALIIHALYHPWQDHDTSSPITIGNFSTTDLRIAMQVEHGRSWGSGTAPIIAELVLDPHCEHCKKYYPLIRNTLEQPIRDGHLQLFIRLRTTATFDGTSPAMRVLYAAAADHQLDTILPTLLGITTNTPLEQRLVGEPATYIDLATEFAHVFDLITAADTQRLHTLHAATGPLPQVVLLRRGERTPAAHLKGEVQPADLLAALNAQLQKP